jgi:excisionase family DNA binding protein
VSTNFSEDDPKSSDWISQAEAARLHGVSRQAISKLIRAGRLKTLSIGGHVLVSRAEILAYRPRAAGRPKSAPANKELDRLLKLLGSCRPETRREVFLHLREEFPIHPLEFELGMKAETILEAIKRANPLTLRGIKGVLAEASFEVNVVSRLAGWTSLAVSGNPAYDFLLDDGNGQVRVQVKLQRSKAGRPMMANEADKTLSPTMFVVETQKTRAGMDRKTSESTRPYRFGEFDVLAVSMHPSTRSWEGFMYTVADWLIVHSDNKTYIKKFQPVVSEPNDDWTGDFQECVRWLRAGTKRTIGTGTRSTP